MRRMTTDIEDTSRSNLDAYCALNCYRDAWVLYVFLLLFVLESQ